MTATQLRISEPEEFLYVEKDVTPQEIADFMQNGCVYTVYSDLVNPGDISPRYVVTIVQDDGSHGYTPLSFMTAAVLTRDFTSRPFAGTTTKTDYCSA